jgi:hypothetical protein
MSGNAHFHAQRFDVTPTGAWPTILATVATAKEAASAVEDDKRANPGEQDANGYGPEWQVSVACTCPRPLTSGGQ